jgi:hypothetical protein
VGVRPRPHRPGQRRIIAERLGDEKGCLGERLRFVDVDPHTLAHTVGQLLDDGTPDKGWMLLDKPAAAFGVVERGDFLDVRGGRD